MLSKQRGFTLIELLVVIAIIAILAAILFPVFAKAREKAYQTQCLSNVKQLGLAFQQYAIDWEGYYPNGWAWEHPELYPGPGSNGHFTFFGAAGWFYPPLSGEMGQLYPYTHNAEVHFCPLYSKAPALLQVANVYGVPEMERWLSYGINVCMLHTFSGNCYGRDSWGFIDAGVKQSTPNDPANTLHFMDYGGPYLGTYILPPSWVNYGSGCWDVSDGVTADYPKGGAEWWETFSPGTRHNGGFNAGFADGHAKWCDIGTYYTCGSATSGGYWDYD